MLGSGRQSEALAPKRRWSAVLKAAQGSRETTAETDGCWRPEGGILSFTTRGQHAAECGVGEIESAPACSLEFCLKQQRNGGI